MSVSQREFGDQSWLGVQPGPQACWLTARERSKARRCPLRIEFMELCRNRLIADGVGPRHLDGQSTIQLPRRFVVGGQGWSVSRSAARATASASIGSDFAPTSVADLSGAISLRVPRTTRRPAAANTPRRRHVAAVLDASDQPGGRTVHGPHDGCGGAVVRSSPSWRPTRRRPAWLYAAHDPTTTMVAASLHLRGC